MVSGKELVVIEESIHRLELKLKKELDQGQRTVVVRGDLPEWVMIIVKEAIPRLAAHTLIIATARWN